MDLERDAWLQDRYARWVERTTWLAFAVSLGAFLLYVSGVLAPYVAPEALPGLWRLPLAEYLQRAHAPIGWDWLGYVRFADYLCNAGVALFALVVLACDVALLPGLLRRRERLLAGIVLAQIVVLAVAASGVFT